MAVHLPWLAWFSVQARIVLLGLAAVLVTAVCSAIFIAQTETNIRAQVFQDQAALARTYTRLVGEYLAGTMNVVEAAAGLPEVRAPIDVSAVDPGLSGIPATADPERRAALLATIRASGRLQGFIQVAPSGDVYVFEPYVKQVNNPAPNIADRSHFQRAVSTGQPAWSDVFVASMSKQPIVVLAVPITDDAGHLNSVLTSALQLNELVEAAAAVKPGQSGAVMLFDSRGVPIVYPDPERVAGAQPLLDIPIVRDGVANWEGSRDFYDPITGQDELGTVVQLPENDWFAVVTQSQAEAFQGLHDTMTTLIVVLSACVLLLVSGALLLARSIARALGAVARAAEGIAEGDLDQEVNVWSRDELGRMAASVRRMIEYQRRMTNLADAIAGGDLSLEVEPQSDHDRLGIALQGMTRNLKELLARLGLRERALAAATSPVAITDARLEDVPITYINPAFEEMTGYRASEIIGRRLRELAGPETDPTVIEKLAAWRTAGRVGTHEIVAYRKDGSAFWMEASVAAVRGDDGAISHCVWVLKDTTERKESEKRAEALARADKLRALGQMASGIAHDLNQSLMLIASYGELAGRALEHDPVSRDELREMFTVVTQAAMDGGRTVRQLLQFASAPVGGPAEPLDLAVLAYEVAQLTAPRWRDAPQAAGHPVRLEVITLARPVTLGPPAALREALTNLIFNAVDALPDGGQIELRVAEEGGTAVVEVADDGIGMSPEVQARIFEPFFTTKGDKGTGLGLASVFGIVERLGGQVRITSAPGKGTTFRLTFPLSTSCPRAPLPAPEASTDTPPAPVADAPSPPRPRQLSILAVDDEPALTKAVVRLLRPRGHKVTTATSAEEALGLMDSQRFDLVLSDVGMGAGINGWEFGERVRARWPDIHFVLATGWGAAIDPLEARAKGITAVLAKPYSAAELDAVVDAVA